MTVVAVVGLGYVGLPLAVEFGKKHKTIGFDLSRPKIDSYRRHHRSDRRTVGGRAAPRPSLFEPTVERQRCRQADFIVVAVPTPVDDAHNPDFGPLVGASEAVGRQS